jgi:hypothetical protein
MPPEGWTWRDASGAGAWTIRLLLLHAGLSAVAAGIAVLRGLQPPSGSQIEVAVALLQMAVFFAAAIATLRWLYLAKTNAFAFGAEDMMVSPGWAIAWFFIPFANLVMPFVAMRETWKASAEPRDWQAAPAPVTLLLWWAAWLGAGAAGVVAFRLTADFGKDAVATAQILFLAADLLSVVSALLLARIVAAIQAMQGRAAELLVRHQFT